MTDDGDAPRTVKQAGERRRVAMLAAALLLASGGAGWAALNWAFGDAPALTAEELGDVRGGFAVPGLPGVTFAFAARVETRISVPGTPELALETVLTFDNPAAASVTTTRTVDGVPEVTTGTVDLMRENIMQALGDPETALVVHELGRQRFATVMQNLVRDADITRHTAVDLTVDGLANFQKRLPPPGVTSTMDAMRHALTQSRR